MEGYRNISYPRKQLKKAYYIGQDPARKKKRNYLKSFKHKKVDKRNF